jgi:GNAT superfamily N-acetyltransferase
MAAGPLTSLPAPAHMPGHQAVGDRALPELPEGIVRLGGPLPLRDGRRVYVRALYPEDWLRLCAFHARLTPETLYLRYGGVRPALSEAEARQLVCVDAARRMSVVATTGDSAAEAIIAVVGYDLIMPAIAEVAFLVEDGWQGLGIGTHLLYVLADCARGQGVATFIAYVLPRNRRMLSVLEQSGFPYAQSGNACGCVEVHLDIALPPVGW